MTNESDTPTLDFQLICRESGVWVTEWAEGGCRTSTDEEIVLWKELSAARQRVAELEAERDAAVKDMEQGFMAGAYARLKNLQDAENRLSTIRLATIEECAKVCESLRPEVFNRNSRVAHISAGGCAEAIRQLKEKL